MNASTRYNPVFIDGYPYIVRLLTSDEWDKVIGIVGADNNLLHYSKSPAWFAEENKHARKIVTLHATEVPW